MAGEVVGVAVHQPGPGRLERDPGSEPPAKQFGKLASPDRVVAQNGVGRREHEHQHVAGGGDRVERVDRHASARWQAEGLGQGGGGRGAARQPDDFVMDVVRE